MNIKLESQFVGWLAYDADCFDVDDGHAYGMYATGDTRQDALAELRFGFEELDQQNRYHVDAEYQRAAIAEIDRQIATHNRTDNTLRTLVDMCRGAQ